MDHKDSMGGCGLDSSGSGKGPATSSCEHSNELADSIKGGISCIAELLVTSQEGL
jgi:hypothetical protein